MSNALSCCLSPSVSLRVQSLVQIAGSIREDAVISLFGKKIIFFSIFEFQVVLRLKINLNMITIKCDCEGVSIF